MVTGRGTAGLRRTGPLTAFGAWGCLARMRSWRFNQMAPFLLRQAGWEDGRVGDWEMTQIRISWTSGWSAPSSVLAPNRDGLHRVASSY